MLRDIIDWTKVWIKFGVMSVPILIMIVMPIIVLTDGLITRSDLIQSFLGIEVLAILCYLFTIISVVFKNCYKKIKERL